jgi:hypothetical protein
MLNFKNFPGYTTEPPLREGDPLPCSKCPWFRQPRDRAPQIIKARTATVDNLVVDYN